MLATPEYIRLQEVEEGLIEDPDEAVALMVVYNSMRVVYEGMQEKALLGHDDAITKSNDTLMTPYDKQSELLAGLIMAGIAPHMRFRGEEGTRTGSGARELGFDPLDGTRNFAAGGADATVIAAVYNPDYSIHGAVIGQPATGRMYSAFGDKPTEGRLIVPGSSGLAETKIHAPEVRIWRGSIADKSQVFIDNNQPFSRNGHVTMTAPQHTDLRRDLQGLGVGVLELGSNGAHQLAVASGSTKAMAAITTARGVWEDTSAGLHLVERSGGWAQRFTANDGLVLPVDSDVLDYDLAVVANSRTNLQIIGSLLI